MEAAKMHYDQLMSVLDKMGMSIEEFMDAQESEPETEDMMEEEGESEESGPDMGKVSMIVAKLKGKKPADSEEYEE